MKRFFQRNPLVIIGVANAILMGMIASIAWLIGWDRVAMVAGLWALASLIAPILLTAMLELTAGDKEPYFEVHVCEYTHDNRMCGDPTTKCSTFDSNRRGRSSSCGERDLDLAHDVGVLT